MDPLDLQNNGLCSNPSFAMYDVKLSDTHKYGKPIDGSAEEAQTKSSS